jgi:hypothetical protein
VRCIDASKILCFFGLQVSIAKALDVTVEKRLRSFDRSETLDGGRGLPDAVSGARA